MKLKILFLSLFIFNIALMVNAKELSKDSISLSASPFSAYRLYKEVENIPINVPTVVEVPFSDEFIERSDFAIFNETTNSFEPYFFKQEAIAYKAPITVSSNPNTNTVDQMNDDDIQTYVDFPLQNDTQGQIQITLTSPNKITSSSITTLLDNNVALPNFIEIRALIEGQERIVVAEQRMDQQTVFFPQTTSDRWIITFTFGQPLRISELRLNQDYVVASNIQTLRFLAQPTHSYKIYFNPDRLTKIPVGEAGNLASAKDVYIISAISSQPNPSYVISDVDIDGIPDILDNCVFVANLDQQDINNNGRGDVCDDFDQDGIINSEDNCPNNPNQDQIDTDSDKIGDVCDKEESRITEKYLWIPWAGIGFAAIILIILFALTAKSIHKTKI